jgi:predicted ATPase/DNA-binding CsgD family transcriptional regulator
VTFDPLAINSTGDLPDIGPVRLPIPLTSMLDRDREVKDLIGLLRRRDVRLVTMTGASGIGKSRLAIEVANRVREAFPGGRYYIQMRTLESAEQVAPVVLDVLRHHHAPEATTVADLADALTGTRVLLVLNGTDPVIDARADIAVLLAHLPTVTALVTSRIALRVRGEHEYPIPYLALPRKGMELDELRRVPSIELFVQRARAVRPSFELNEHNAADIADIVRRLDGLPIAIELAALRTRLFPVKVIRERMDYLLDFLAGGPHDMAPHHQNLRALIGFGYNLLSPHEQEVFRKLSVFSGPFSLEAAREVLKDQSGKPPAVGDLIEDLAQMLDYSLIMSISVSDDDSELPAPVLTMVEAGYRMPETTRAFGREKLGEHGERDDALAKQLAFYVEVLKRYEKQVRGPRQTELLTRLDKYAKNFHAALISAREDGKRTGDALRVATRLAPYWLLRGQVIDGASFLETFLERESDVTDDERAEACSELGSLLVDLNRLDQAWKQHERALELYERSGNREGIVDSWNNLGVVAMKMGDIEEARALIDRALEARRAGDDEGRLAQTLADRGDLALIDGDDELARTLHDEAYRIHMDMANLRAVACDCLNLIMCVVAQDTPEPVDHLYEIGTRFAHDVEDQQSLAQLQVAYALLKFRHTRTYDALGPLAGALRVILASESRRLTLETLPMVAEVCVYLDDDRLAAQVLGALTRAVPGKNRFAWYRGRRQAQALLEGIRERLGEGEFARYTALGAYQTSEQTIQAVLDLIDERIESDTVVEDDPPGESLEEMVPLTGRETEVLALVAEGLSDKAIAEELGISPRTAMTHVSNIMTKMKVHSRSAASEYGIRMGVVRPPREDH